jgi:phosphatidylinositol dimannoside acyltransferase
MARANEATIFTLVIPNVQGVSRRVVTPAYKSAAVIARALPKPVAAAVGDALAIGMYRLMSKQRAMVASHQQRIASSVGVNGELPRALSASELNAQVRKAFTSYARYWVEAFRLHGKNTEQVDAGIVIEGREYVDAALALGNGVIMAMPHIGAWDYGGTWMAHHWPISIVAERLEPPELFAWFCRERESNGMRVIPLGPEAGTPLMAALRRNEVVGLLCDRDIAGGGIEVEFFGERTTMPAGPATLSLRTGAQILPNAVFQREHDVLGFIRPPINFERTGKLRADVTALTQLIATELETLIARAPEQWHVLQPLWPSDHALRAVKSG